MKVDGTNTNTKQIIGGIRNFGTAHKSLPNSFLVGRDVPKCAPISCLNGGVEVRCKHRLLSLLDNNYINNVGNFFSMFTFFARNTGVRLAS